MERETPLTPPAAGETYSKFPLLPGDQSSDLGVRFANIRRCSVVEVSEVYVWPEHLHTLTELMFALEGDYVCALNGETVTVPPGSAIMIQTGDRHADCCRGKSVFLALVFSLNGLLEKPGFDLFEPGKAANRIFRFADSPHFLQILDAAAAESKSADNPFRHKICSAFAEVLLWKSFYCLRERLSPSCLSAFEEGVFRRQVTELFTAHLNGKLSVDEMAAEFGMSRRGLSYKFREQFRCGPARLFMAYKIRHAVMLRERGMSAKEIAAALGFANQFHFSRVYRTFARRDQ